MADCNDVLLVEVDNTTVVTQIDVETLLVDSPSNLTVLSPVTETLLVDDPHFIILQSDGGSGPAGPPGSGSTVTVIASAVIQAFHVVGVDSTGDIYMADYTAIGDFFTVLGIALTSALPGEPVAVAIGGLLVTPALWAPGPLYLGTAGTLVSVPPTTDFHLQVAVATSPSLLIVRPEFSIALA